MDDVLARAATLYAMAHAPWSWQSRLRARLAAAYVQGVRDAWAVMQQPAVTNTPRRNTPPGEHP
jgi:hypothetical protein